MKVVIIDNYDSFTFNLSHMVKTLGADVTVWKNDRFHINDLSSFDKILLSPGPGIPSEAGLLMETIHTYAGQKPILGVCLGHQAIGEVFGGKLTNLSHVFHGIQSPCRQQNNDYLFNGLPETFPVGRYHSWIVSNESFPNELQVTATSEEGYIMALKHKKYDVRGIQFHPESVLTPFGKSMLANWLSHQD